MVLGPSLIAYYQFPQTDTYGLFVFVAMVSLLVLACVYGLPCWLGRRVWRHLHATPPGRGRGSSAKGYSTIA